MILDILSPHLLDYSTDMATMSNCSLSLSLAPQARPFPRGEGGSKYAYGHILSRKRNSGDHVGYGTTLRPAKILPIRKSDTATLSKGCRPHSSSASGRCAPSGTFPPGEGIAAFGRCRPMGATSSVSNKATNWNLKFLDALKDLKHRIPAHSNRCPHIQNGGYLQARCPAVGQGLPFFGREG